MLIEHYDIELNLALIDNAIQHWRKRLSEAKTEQDKHTARCYIDAYQCVRQWHDLPRLEGGESDPPPRGL